MNVEEELNKLEELGFDICTVDSISASYTLDEYNQLFTDLNTVEIYYTEVNESKFICYYSLEEIKTTLEILKS